MKAVREAGVYYGGTDLWKVIASEPGVKGSGVITVFIAR